MTSITQTLTLTPSDLISWRPQPQKPKAAPALFKEVGDLLEPEQAAKKGAVPLSDKEEKLLFDKIQNLRLQGAEDALFGLVNDMGSASFLSQETLTSVYDWYRQFLEIDPEDREARSLAFAILVIRVIHPAVAAGGSLDEQSQMLDWEDVCRSLLQQTLSPEENLDDFLDSTETDLRRESLLRDLCKRADAVAEAQLDFLQKITQTSNEEIEHGCADIKQRLAALHGNRIQGREAAEKMVEALSNEIGNLIHSTTSEAESIRDRVDELAAVLNEQNQTLEEGQKLLETSKITV